MSIIDCQQSRCKSLHIYQREKWGNISPGLVGLIEERVGTFHLHRPSLAEEVSVVGVRRRVMEGEVGHLK